MIVSSEAPTPLNPYAPGYGAIAVLDVTDLPQVICANQAFALLLDCTPEDLIGRPFCPPFVRRFGKEGLDRLSTALRRDYPDMIRVRPAGDEGEGVKLRVQPLGSEEGMPTTVVLRTASSAPSHALDQFADRPLVGLSIIDIVSDPDTDTPEFRYRAMNRRLATLLDLTADRVVGHAPREVMATDMADKAIARYRACLTERRPLLFVHRLDGPGGTALYHQHMFPQPNTAGRMAAIVDVWIDRSDRLHARPERNTGEHKLDRLFEQAGFGFFEITSDGLILDLNEALERMLGRHRHDVVGRSLNDFAVPDEHGKLAREIRTLVMGERSALRDTVRLVRGDGSILRMRITLSAGSQETDAPRTVIGLAEDMTAAGEAEDQIHYLASFDRLSGLPNLSLFERRVDAEIDRMSPDGGRLAVVMVAFDRLANIRITLGHEATDMLIRSIVDRLRTLLGPADVAARIGDDLFAIMLPNLNPDEDGTAVVKAIIAAFCDPLDSREDLLVPPTIGIGLFPADGATAPLLLRNAGAALRRARETGLNRYEFYTRNMELAAVTQLSLESRLRHAIERQELELVYQPQASITDLSVIGFEALVRWRPDGAEPISPMDFIPLAEETGLIIPLGELVLRTACAQASRWRAQGLIDVPVSVNLSGRQITDPRLVPTVFSILKETGLPADRLKLEMTETTLFRSTPAIRGALMDLHHAGVCFMLDDFGTGYSSLSYLKRFPIDAIKIDKSFVDQMVGDPDAASIVHAIINMAHALRMKVVAEGVETEEQHVFLRAYRCDWMQGYLFSRPLTPENIAERLYEQSFRP